MFGRKRQGRRSSTPKQRSNGKVKREFDLFDRCSGDYVVIDVETTGLQPENSSIIELAALKINNGNIVDTYETLVNHGKNVSKEITKINGITTEMLKGKPSIEKVLPEYLLFIGNNPVMGHNIAFDVKFILFNSIKCGLSFDPPYVVDTLLLSRIAWPELENHKLPTLVDYLGIQNQGRHRALADADSTYKLYLKYAELFQDKWLAEEHFELNSTITKFYRKRESELGAWQKALEACERQIQIAPSVAKYFCKEGYEMTGHSGFKHLAIIYEKQGKYAEVITLLTEALKEGWVGDWDKRISRCQRKKNSINHIQ